MFELEHWLNETDEKSDLKQGYAMLVPQQSNSVSAVMLPPPPPPLQIDSCAKARPPRFKTCKLVAAVKMTVPKSTAPRLGPQESGHYRLNPKDLRK